MIRNFLHGLHVKLLFVLLLVTHFLQEFWSNVHYTQLGYILYIGLVRKTLKRSCSIHGRIPASIHCSESLLGVEPGAKDCLTTPVCEVLLFVEILVYVSALTFGKVRHELLITSEFWYSRCSCPLVVPASTI
jgi:hypothetical protein